MIDYLVNKTFDTRVDVSPDHHNLSNSYIRLPEKESNKIYLDTIDGDILIKNSNQSVEKNNKKTKNYSSLDKLKKPFKIIEKKVKDSSHNSRQSITKTNPDNQKFRPILNSIGRYEPSLKYRYTPSKSNIRGPNPQLNKSLNIVRGSYPQEKDTFNKLQPTIGIESNNILKSPHRQTVNINQGKDSSFEKKFNISTTKKKSKFDEFNKLTDKEIAEMNQSLLGFYDLLIERDQSNSKLLCNLKENFSLFMKEFKNNIKLRKQYEQENGHYKEQLVIAIRDKNEVHTQLELLKQEHTKLAMMVSNEILEENNQYMNSNTSSAAEISSKSQKDCNKNSEGQMSGIKLQNHLHQQTKDDLAYEHKKLLFLLQKQQNVIHVMKQKEAKYIKLLIAIKQKGINIEDIYNHNVKTSNSETSNTITSKASDPHLCVSSNKNSYPSLIKIENQLIQSSKSNEIIGDTPIKYNLEQNDHPNNYQIFSEESSEIQSSTRSFMKYEDYQPEQETRTFVNTLNNVYERNYENRVPINSATFFTKHRPNSQNTLKDKLKLDLSILNESTQNEIVDNTNNNKSLLGFHEEFMSKINEFSLSWRIAAMKEKKF